MRRPWAIAYWKGPPETKERCWRTERTARMRSVGPVAQPTFHPVNEKLLPALPSVIVRSAMPGRVAMGMWGCPSYQRCS